ncbi:acyl-CoA thioesterase [Jatrophihabitans sp. YIM 134969]
MSDAATAHPDVVDQDLLDALVRLLDIETLDDAAFLGQSPETSLQRVFGGQVAGQALVAAGRTVDPERRVHSLHAYFIRPGDPSRPILYLVENVRDGRSFSVRRVVAQQHGKTIFTLSASFQLPQPGFEHGATMPAVPGAHEVPSLAELLERGDAPPRFLAVPNPIDLRYLNPPWAHETPREDHRLWLKAKGTLPDDPLLHVCVATFASDFSLLEASLVRQGRSWDRDEVVGASLDHAMWFHQPFRVDEWLLYDTASPAASGGRGLNEGRMFTASGEHAVTVLQEGMLRLRGV